MIVIFVHGWSVTHTETYGELPRWLESQGNRGGLDIQVGNVYLGRYVSFDDTVTVDDIARAFDQAVRDELAAKLKSGQRFACVTHSTGGPVVRKWMDLYFKDKLDKCPLSHLIMLAPANHGSALAQLGKSRLSRIKSFFGGVEPGQRVLDWLELGSDAGWQLNESWLDYDCPADRVYPFVLTGQKIDRSLYDALNSYTGEAGSDGVVRVTAANMNYGLLRLRQDGEKLVVDKVRRSHPMALGVLPGRSHSGDEIGIIRSVRMANADTHPTAQWVLRCLQVSSRTAYTNLSTQLDKLTTETQARERIEKVRALVGTRTYITNRCSMVVFRLVDDRCNQLVDYDLFITAGPNYDEDELPEGFFKDRQRNQRNPGKLTYFLDYDIMEEGLNRPNMDGKLGFRIRARPEVSDSALAFYSVLDFHSSVATIDKILRPNETVMVEVTLQRHVDKTVFRLSNDLTPSYIDSRPMGSLAEGSPVDTEPEKDKPKQSAPEAKGRQRFARGSLRDPSLPEHFQKIEREKERNKVFISYSHKDKGFLEDLLLHLKPLEREGLISKWSDEQIVPGSLWLDEIKAAIASTRVAVMMVSAGFLASDFIHEEELGPLLKEARQGGVTILWIPVRACSYKETPLKDYQAIIPPDKPLARMKVPERDEALVKVCQEIRRALDRSTGQGQ